MADKKLCELKGEDFFVGKVLDRRRRTRNGKVEYYVLKWQDYSEEDSTWDWEPEENLNCPDLIQAFEEAQKKQEADLKKRKSAAATPDLEGAMKTKTDEMKTSGFDRGLEPEKITGATDTSGELMFIMKWQGTNKTELVPAKQANIKCPQVVIQFYEERLSFKD